MKKKFSIYCIFPILCLYSFVLNTAPPTAVKNTGSLLVKINPVFNSKPLQLNNTAYVTENGDTVYIDLFKFYISAVTLTDGNLKLHAEQNSYHLINAEDSTSLYFKLDQLPAGSLKTISFAIGVDSVANTSGALDGALDPVKGMYWAWNTGYINAKVEGHSSSCKTLHHAFEFHIGGCTAPYNTLRTVSLPLPGVTIFTDKKNQIELNADVAEWFKGPLKIEVSKTNSIVIPCKEALMLADNYKDMFTVSKTTHP